MPTHPHFKPTPRPARTTGPELVRHITPETTIDDALVRRFNAGDETAFVEIVNRYRPKIQATTLSLLHNHADADEITQDTFIRAHRALANFRGDSSLSTWLHRIAVNLSRNRYWYFFRRRRQDSISLDSALSDQNTGTLSDLVADAGQDPAQETLVNEFSHLVGRSMERLDTRHREVLRLRNILHHSYEEIAATLGINVGTVKSRIARARENLRFRLSELCPEFACVETTGEWFLRPRTIYRRTEPASA